MNPIKSIITMILALVLSGCATSNPKDPFENFNRVMFNFNDALDQAAVKPAAEAYSNLPSFVQTGVSNFFGNLNDVWTGANNFMQGKIEEGLSDVMRVTLNTTMGLGGLLDIGSEAGLAKHNEDFGQTLGKWGVASGPYVVLPVFGPSTLRDTVVYPLDMEANPWHHVRPVHTRTIGSVVRAVDIRAQVLNASSLVEDAALDRYQFIRDAYLQRRQNRVYDGDPPTSAYEHDVGPTVTSEQETTVAATSEPDLKPVVQTEKNNSGSSSAAVSDSKEKSQ